MFYILIMIQWYNKSLCNWSCSFSDMSISFLLGLLFPCHFFFLPKKENKSYDQKPYDRQKLPGCTPVGLPIHSHNREKERKRDREREKGKKGDTIFMFWRLEMGISSLWGAEKHKIYFALSETSTLTLPDWRLAQRLTSIAVCSGSGQIRWRPTHW